MSLFTKDLYDRVYTALSTVVYLRDNDQALVSRIWLGDMIAAGYNNPSYVTVGVFLSLYANGKLTNSDTITRCRRKIQQENPSLRGNRWSERHTKDDEVREFVRHEHSH